MFENEELDIRGAISPPGIEIIEPLTPDVVTSKILERHGEGLTLLSLKEPNLD